MEIAYILSRGLYPYLLPSIMSYLDHNEIENIYIVAEDEKLPYELPKQCTVIKVDPSDYFKGSPNYQNRWTPFVMLKAVLTKILPIDKVLYVDVDTICADNLGELWDTDLKDCYVAAVPETAKRDYFNAGVMLLNLKQMREDKADELLIERLNTTIYGFVEQDAFNEVARERKIELPVRFNETNYTGKTDTPAIVHYAACGAYWLTAQRDEYYRKYAEYQR